MPRAAAMTSSMKIPTFGAGRFTQAATGEWLPAAITWTTIASTPCRIFPASERAVQAIWGEGLQVDCIAWVLDSVTLPPQVLTADSGAQTPVQVDGVEYLVIRVRDVSNMKKLKEIYLRRFTHG